MNWISKNIFEAIANFVDGLLEYVSQFITVVFNSASVIQGNSVINGVVAMTTVWGTLLVSLFVVKQIFSIYIIETEGDSEADPLNLLVRASVAIALIINNGIIYDLLLRISTNFANQLVSSLNQINIEAGIAGIVGAIVSNTVGVPISAAFRGVWALIYIICTLILCIKGGLRGCLLAIQKLLFPLFACDIITVRRDRWNNFLTAYVTTFFGYAIQLFCFRLSASYFSEYCGSSSIMALLWSFSWMFLAIKTPKELDKYVYTSGTGQTIGGVGRSAGYMLPNLLRAKG